MSNNLLRFNRSETDEISSDARRLLTEIDAMHVPNGDFLTSAEFLKRLVMNAQTGLPAQAFVITGPTGSGKSHVLEIFRGQDIFKTCEDEEGTIQPLVHVVAPSPCTLKTLGAEILLTMTGEPSPVRLHEHEIWNRVRAQLKGQRTAILLLDELHHVLIGRQDQERTKISETLKNLMQIPDNPVQLVLAGVPALKEFTKKYPQLHRRCRHFTFERVLPGQAGVDQIEGFLALLETKMPEGFTANLRKDDLPERLAVAADGYLGGIATIVKAACRRAVQDEFDTVEIEDFADEFRDIHECGPEHNPFMELNIKSEKPPQPGGDTSRKTRLKGKAAKEREDA